MRLRLRLPEVRPDEYKVPMTCPYGCGGRYFALHQQCQKELSDPNHPMVQVRRYKCVRCGRSFRVHPTGVGRQHRSQRLRGIGVMLYVLGLSYGGVADALAAFGWAGSKSSVYRDVQAAGEAVARVRQRQPAAAGESGQRRCDLCCLSWAAGDGGRSAGCAAGDVLDIELVDSESADALRAFLTQLQEEYGMEVLLSDDQDSYKTLADELGVEHSICRAHVNRNVARIVAELAEEALRGRTAPPPGVQSDLEQVLADLEYLQQLIALRPPDGAAQLSGFLRRYQAAPPPRQRPESQPLVSPAPGHPALVKPMAAPHLRYPVEPPPCPACPACPAATLPTHLPYSAWMAPTMSPNVPSAAGSRIATAPCVPSSVPPPCVTSPNSSHFSPPHPIGPPFAALLVA